MAGYWDGVSNLVLGRAALQRNLLLRVGRGNGLNKKQANRQFLTHRQLATALEVFHTLTRYM
jgi:hypothetical protein